MSFFRVCCGEGEEEAKFGALVDASEYGWDDKKQKEIQRQKEKIRSVEQQIAILGQHRPDNDSISFAPQLRRAVATPQVDLQAAFEPPVYPKTAAQEEFLLEILQDNFLFMDLSSAEMTQLIKAMQQQTVSEGAVIIQQGDVGDYYFIVENGTVDFILDDTNCVGHCQRGGSFGELALLYDSPRAVSCVAKTTVDLWKVDQHTFRYMLAHYAQQHCSSTKDLLRKIPIFKDLDENDLCRFTNSLTTVHWKDGARIVQKGQPGQVFYIMQEGHAKIHDIGLGDSNFQDQILGPGDWFGERALLTGEPRAANVTALSDVTTMAMDRSTFERCLGPLQNLMEREMRRNFLKSLPIFAKANVTAQELNQLVDLITQVRYPKGHKLAQRGKPQEPALWIIRHGRLLVYGDDNKIYNLESGDHFGDKSLTAPEELSTHTAIAEEDLTAWMLTREDTESVLGDIDRLGETTGLVKKYVPDPTIHLGHLTKRRVLGQGAFGTVWLVSHDDRGYALKEISKRLLVDSKQVSAVLREKEMLCLLQHPFILHLKASFQDEAHVYLLLPIVSGGELFRVLHSQKRRNAGLPNDNAAFYAACIIEAIGHFHQRQIAYRDLKLENVLLDEQGYCKIIDLGFAKLVPDKTWTLVGTPEYLAPEIIMSKGHNKAADYWAFGVLVYELLVGKSPFYVSSSSQVDMYKRAVMGIYDIPNFVNKPASNLIQELLVRKQTKRLGNLAAGYLDIKRHEWFEGSRINFRSILRKEEKAPWVPKVKDEFDASNFDDYGEEERRPDYEKRLTKEEQSLFVGF